MILFLLFSCLYLPSLFHLFAPTVSQLHDLCLGTLSPTLTTFETQSAFLCGSDLQTRELRQIYQQTGLLHLIVVSGSHLLFLQSGLRPWLGRWSWSRPLVSLILVFYAFATLLDPPVVRAIAQMALQKAQKRLRLFWSTEQVTLGSGLFCLILFPQWVFSYSLILSWLAALFISQSRSLWIQSICCYFGLLPIICQWTTIHPLTILINTLMAPLFGVVVFPLMVVGIGIPPLQAITDLFWQVIEGLLREVAANLPENRSLAAATTTPLPLLWGYLFIVQAGLNLKYSLRLAFLKRPMEPRHL